MHQSKNQPLKTTKSYLFVTLESLLQVVTNLVTFNSGKGAVSYLIPFYMRHAVTYMLGHCSYVVWMQHQAQFLSISFC